jgi:hypothetical protein
LFLSGRATIDFMDASTPSPSRSRSFGRTIIAGLVLLVAAWLLLHVLVHLVVFLATIVAVVFAVVAVVWALKVLL